jgi:hypothetical protein
MTKCIALRAGNLAAAALPVALTPATLLHEAYLDVAKCLRSFFRMTYRVSPELSRRRATAMGDAQRQ